MRIDAAATTSGRRAKNEANTNASTARAPSDAQERLGQHAWPLPDELPVARASSPVTPTVAPEGAAEARRRGWRWSAAWLADRARSDKRPVHRRSGHQRYGTPPCRRCWQHRRPGFVAPAAVWQRRPGPRPLRCRRRGGQRKALRSPRRVRLASRGIRSRSCWRCPFQAVPAERSRRPNAPSSAASRPLRRRRQRASRPLPAGGAVGPVLQCASSGGSSSSGGDIQRRWPQIADLIGRGWDGGTAVPKSHIDGGDRRSSHPGGKAGPRRETKLGEIERYSELAEPPLIVDPHVHGNGLAGCLGDPIDVRMSAGGGQGRHPPRSTLAR